MKIPELSLTGAFFASDGTPTPSLGVLLLKAINALIGRTGGVLGQALPLESYRVATVPSAAANPRSLIYVTDETGGEIPAFSDGTNWRRITDRAIIS